MESPVEGAERKKTDFHTSKNVFFSSAPCCRDRTGCDAQQPEKRWNYPRKKLEHKAPEENAAKRPTAKAHKWVEAYLTCL